MPPSAPEVIAGFEAAGWRQISQRGSDRQL
jgi:predicted RNA binding protein YcfA (HicA-like mRNA interferase family)